ncbi:MAG: hypothetical protein AB7S74_01795 [Hyphomicrobium sp.]
MTTTKLLYTTAAIVPGGFFIFAIALLLRVYLSWTQRARFRRALP